MAQQIVMGIMNMKNPSIDGANLAIRSHSESQSRNSCDFLKLWRNLYQKILLRLNFKKQSDRELAKCFTSDPIANPKTAETKEQILE